MDVIDWDLKSRVAEFKLSPKKWRRLLSNCMFTIFREALQDNCRLCFLEKELMGFGTHTGLVCYEREFFYGGDGINSCSPGGTILGSPDEVIDLGDTEITQDVFMDYLSGIGQQDFRGEKYNLFEHNCNTFSSEVAMFLTGNKIPQHIQDLPSEVLNTSFGQMIRPMIDSMSVRPSGGTPVSASASVPKGTKSVFEPRPTAAATSGCQSSEPRKANTYSPVDMPLTVTRLKENLASTQECTDEDANHLDELKKCFETNNLAGVKEKQIQILDRAAEKCYTEEEEYPALLHTLQLLQVLSSCEQLFSTSKGLQDIVKRTCTTFSSVNSRSSQVECAKLFCCAISHMTGHSFMFEDSRSVPLAAVTVNCLLSKDTGLQSVGAALVSNISRFKVHEDIALECSTAVIEVLSRDVPPETAHNCLFALRRFMDYNAEVAGLASVMGVTVDKYKGNCSEVDQLCNDLEKLLR